MLSRFLTEMPKNIYRNATVSDSPKFRVFYWRIKVLKLFPQSEWKTDLNEHLENQLKNLEKAIKLQEESPEP